MKHALATVALLGLVVGCGGTTDATPDDPGASTPAAGGTSGAGMQDGGSASVTTVTSGSVASTGSGTFGSGPSAAGTFGSGTFGSGNVGSTTGGGDTVGGVGGSGGDGGGVDCEGGAGGEAGAGNYPEDPFPAIAMTRAQRQAWLDEQSNGASGSSTTGSVAEDPEDIWVVITDTALVCNGLASWPPCGGHWRVDLMLTRSMQQLGVHSLAGEWFGTAYSSQAEDPEMPDLCGGGGGGGISCGSLEVLAIDDHEIRFLLRADPWSVEEDIDGIYTVPRCP